MAALPDDETIEHFGRLLYGDAWISSLTERERWLLDKYKHYWVDPPMIAVGEAINGGTNLYAGGITWTDVKYDERIRMVRGRWLILPSDPALAREVEEAVSRRDRMDVQRSEVTRQLRNGAGFPPAVRQGGEAQQACPKKALADWQAEGLRVELCPQTEIAVPPRHHRDYALLWELADAMAKEDNRSAEICWREIMNAFWLGELPALFCFFQPTGGRPGRLLRELPLREVLAAHLLGRSHDIDPTELCAWGFADYQKHEPFRFYTTRDDWSGLAIRRSDFQGWRAKHELPRSPAPFDPQERPQAKDGNEPPADGPTRPVTEKRAGQLADKYIAEEEAQGRRPTVAGFEAAVREAGEHRGGREYLRTAYRQRRNPSRGRPRKSPK